MIAGPSLEVDIRGAPWKLLEDVLDYDGPKTVREYLIEGPAGTGKSRGIGEVLWHLSTNFPGIRILILRDTRESLTESFLPMWEDEVIGNNRAVLRGAARNNRHSYSIPDPEGGPRRTEVILGGLNEPSRLLSTNYDVIYVQQTEEIDLDVWAKLRTRLRNFGHPNLRLQLLIADVNPVEPEFWANARAEDGAMTRLVSRHEDNPRWHDGISWSEEGTAYIESLDAMPEGVDKERLRWGRWSARAGLVWANFNKSVHVIDLPEGEDPYKQLGITWYVGSIDWGFEHPGCFQVWGVTEDNTAYRVAEWYKTKETLPWWTERIVQASREFKPFRAIVADPSRPDSIAHVNQRLGADGFAHIVRPANNKKTKSGPGDFSGLDLVRSKLQERKLFWIRGALREVDEALARERRPTCSEREAPQYIYELDDSGKPVAGEHTAKTCRDDGCDATRYGVCFVWQKDLSDLPKPKTFAPGSLGQRLGHAKLLARMR